MAPTNLLQVSAVYDVAATAQYSTRVLDVPSYSRFEASLTSLMDECAHIGDESPELMRQLIGARWIKYCLLSSPFPFSITRVLFAREMSGFKDNQTQFRSVGRLAQNAGADALHELSNLSDCFDVERAGSMADAGFTVKGPVVVSRSKVAGLSAAIEMPYSVLTPSDLRGCNVFDQLSFWGPKRIYPSYVTDAPRANEIVFYSLKEVPATIATEEAWAVRIDAASERLASSMLTGTALGSATGDSIEAFQFIVDSDCMLFLDADEDATCIVLDTGAGSRLQPRRISTKRLMPGLFVLVRVGSDSDYVEAIADSLMGRHAAALRARQAKWKTALARAIYANSAGGVSRRLKQMGGVHCSSGNVLRWSRAGSIRPLEQADFDAVLRLLGLGDECSRYWEEMRRIEGAHRKAGQLIRRELIRTARSTTASALADQSRIEFSLPEAPSCRLAAVRVVARAPSTRTITVGALGRLLE